MKFKEDVYGGFLIRPDKVIAVGPCRLIQNKNDDNYLSYIVEVFLEGGATIIISLNCGDALPDPYTPNSSSEQERARLAESRRDDFVFQILGITQ